MDSYPCCSSPQKRFHSSGQVTRAQTSQKILNFLAANARMSRKKVMELERAAGAQVKTEMDTSGDNMNSGIQVAEEDLMMSLNLKEQLQVMTELNQSIGEKMKCLEELQVQTQALDSSMTTLKEKTIPEITSTVSKSGGEIVQSISALIGNSLLDIHGKIDKNVQRVNDLQTSTHNQLFSCVAKTELMASCLETDVKGKCPRLLMNAWQILPRRVKILCSRLQV